MNDPFRKPLPSVHEGQTEEESGQGEEPQIDFAEVNAARTLLASDEWLRQERQLLERCRENLHCLLALAQSEPDAAITIAQAGARFSEAFDVIDRVYSRAGYRKNSIQARITITIEAKDEGKVGR